MSDFDIAFPWIIKWEGSYYENVPGDDGGPTKFGIDSASHPEVDIRNLTINGAKEIYQEEWNSCLSATLGSPLDIVYFNYHVNTGPERANKLLQASLGLEQDGDIGPESKLAISQIQDFVKVSRSMVCMADAFYHEISVGHNAQFLKGWINRNEDLIKTFLNA